MSGKTSDTDIPPSNVCPPIAKLNHKLTNQTKMFILPPHILQNIRLNDSLMKAGNTTSTAELSEKDNNASNKPPPLEEKAAAASVESPRYSKKFVKPNTSSIVNRKRGVNSKADASLASPKKVPRISKKNEGLVTKVEGERVGQSKESLDINIFKKKDDKNAEKPGQGSFENAKLPGTVFSNNNVQNIQETTSKSIPKFEGANNTSKHAISNVKLEETRKKSTGNLEKNPPKKADRVNSKTYCHKVKDKEADVIKSNEIEGSINKRPKRIRKQTKFDDYITEYPREVSDDKSDVDIDMPIITPEKNITPSKRQKKGRNSKSSSAETSKARGNVNCKEVTETQKTEQEVEEPKDNLSVTSVTSTPPALTRELLPFDDNSKKRKNKSASNKSRRSSSNVSTIGHFDIKNIEGNSYIKHSESAEGTYSAYKKCDDTINIYDRYTNSNEGIIDNHKTESANCKQNSTTVENTFTKANANSDKEFANINRSKNTINVETTTTTSPFIQETLNGISTNQDDSNDNMPDKLLPEKEASPRKILPPSPRIQDVPDTLEENISISESVDNISAAQSMTESEQAKESCSTDVDDTLKDDSSTGDNTSNVRIVRARGRPAGVFKNTGENNRARGRSRGRGRGKGRGSSHSSLGGEHTEGGPNNATGDAQNSDPLFNVPEDECATCAKCEMRVLKKQWNQHNLSQHNNMAWKKGDEPMDFENDIKLYRRVLMFALKKRRGQLTCEKCGEVKRSANGFISHMQFCGKSDNERQALMMKCPICGAVMMPSSMEIHERTHRQTKKARMDELNTYTTECEKGKRKAAEKAVSKIMEFTELVKEDTPGAKKLKQDSEASLFKSIVRLPELTKFIPTVWKGAWKRELSTTGTTQCRQRGCTYISTSFDDICEHFSKCNFTPQENYLCKICNYITINMDEMKVHVIEKHIILNEPDKNSDFEAHSSSDESKSELFAGRRKAIKMNELLFDRPSKTFHNMKFLEKEQLLKLKWHESYLPALKWTMEFEQDNYEFNLFDDYLPNPFVLLKDADAAKYLPQLDVSMRVKKATNDWEELPNVETEWKCWKRFEGGFQGDTPVFFAGGPVWAMAWLTISVPMYNEEPTQYVAVSTHPTMTSEYAVGKSYSEPNIIQIWKVGRLRDEIDKAEPPILSYAIAHNNGTSWSMEWCPSGCYQDEFLCNYQAESQTELRRMGILAAAASDGSVYVYSLPFPEDLKFEATEDSKLPIYHTDPILVLVVNTMMYDNKQQKWQCTRLSWTKEHGHNTLAAGFSNGYIALWDLTIKSPLTMQKRGNTFFVNAFQHFYAHGNAVSMVALVPYNGQRFLASGSTDRSYKFWNLENTSTPQTCIQKGIIVDGTWMLNWLCSVVGFDDALGYNHTNSYLIPLREYGFKIFPILATNSPTYSIATSDYANAVSQGTLAGEIVTIFPHHFLLNRDVEKILHKKRQLSSRIKIVDFLESETEETKGESKDEEKGESKDETKGESKDEAKGESKDEAKGESKDETKGDSKNETKGDSEDETKGDSEDETKGDSKDETNLPEYNYMPETYDECKDRFGIVFYDDMRSTKGSDHISHQKSLSADSLSTVPVEEYPFMSVNKITWNPNTWSYLWMACGYQNGLVRLLNFKHMSMRTELNVLISQYAKYMLDKAKGPTRDADDNDQ